MTELEGVTNFTYLGINFNTRGITAGTKKERLISAEKAMFSTLVKCKQNKLPIDISLEMFEKTVIPCALYGAEIFGFNSVAGIETLQLKYIKYSLKLKKSTPTVLVYGETGMLPIEYYVKCRMLGFWVYLVTTKQEKISYKLFTICTFLFLRGLLICPWLQEIKNILEQRCNLLCFISRVMAFFATYWPFMKPIHFADLVKVNCEIFQYHTNTT